MALRQSDLEMLRRLAQRHLTAIDLVTDDKIKLVQKLVSGGYAIDFADMKGRRTPVRLRIWGISPAGKAILEQQALIDSIKGRDKQMSLTLVKKPLELKKRALQKREPLAQTVSPIPKKELPPTIKDIFGPGFIRVRLRKPVKVTATPDKGKKGDKDEE